MHLVVFQSKMFLPPGRFYSEVLGLTIEEPMGQLSLHLAGGGTVFLYEKPDHVPAVFTVLNFPVRNLKKAMDQLTAKGLKFEHYNNDDIVTDEEGVFNGEGIKIAWFKDPSGNILSVLEEEGEA